VGHTTLSTGTDPRLHGIVGNSMYDRARRRERLAYQGCSPRDLALPTLADLWLAQTDGQAIILAQGGNAPSATALAGHGACTLGGRPVLRACYQYEGAEGRWSAGTDSCFVLPEPLRGLAARSVWGQGGSWMGQDIRSPRRVRHSAPFARFEGDAAVAAIEHEPLGADEVPDLVLVNLKAIDFVGHTYGPDSPEVGAALAAVDSQIARIVGAVERKVGASRYVVAITADHGMPAAPPARRHRAEELTAAVHERFDREQRRLVLHYECEDSQLFLDEGRLEELGLGLDDVARHLEAIPYLFAAYTEPEVRRAAAALARR
jgi:hypothetical protein